MSEPRIDDLGKLVHLARIEADQLNDHVVQVALAEELLNRCPNLHGAIVIGQPPLRLHDPGQSLDHLFDGHFVKSDQLVASIAQFSKCIYFAL